MKFHHFIIVGLLVVAGIVLPDIIRNTHELTALAARNDCRQTYYLPEIEPEGIDHFTTSNLPNIDLSNLPLAPSANRPPLFPLPRLIGVTPYGRCLDSANALKPLYPPELVRTIAYVFAGLAFLFALGSRQS
jgi:hypothetical protein